MIERLPGGRVAHDWIRMAAVPGVNDSRGQPAFQWNDAVTRQQWVGNVDAVGDEIHEIAPGEETITAANGARTFINTANHAMRSYDPDGVFLEAQLMGPSGRETLTHDAAADTVTWARPGISPLVFHHVRGNEYSANENDGGGLLHTDGRGFHFQTWAQDGGWRAALDFDPGTGESSHAWSGMRTPRGTASGFLRMAADGTHARSERWVTSGLVTEVAAVRRPDGLAAWEFEHQVDTRRRKNQPGPWRVDRVEHSRESALSGNGQRSETRVTRIHERARAGDDERETAHFSETRNGATTARDATWHRNEPPPELPNSLTDNDLVRCFGLGTQPDRRFDGMLVAADGRAYPSGFRLSDLPAVTPSTPIRTPESDETLIFVNGIQNDLRTQVSSMQLLANRTGARVVGVHNATTGFVADVGQCANDKTLQSGNPPVDSLAELLHAELVRGGLPGGAPGQMAPGFRDLHVVAHSQGALVTSRALEQLQNRLIQQDRLTADQARAMMAHVKVETFGGAAMSYVDGPQYVHYVNRADLVPDLFGLNGVTPQHPGAGAAVRHFLLPADPGAAHSFDELYLSMRVPFDEARAGRSG